jgi:methylmalonyl-CoA mutase
VESYSWKGDYDYRIMVQIAPTGILVVRGAGKNGQRAFMQGYEKAQADKIRLVTAASLFDGHDAAINIMRRIMQSSGAEIIHLGHNRSVQEIVDCAIQEDVQGIAITSYQGGHNRVFQIHARPAQGTRRRAYQDIRRGRRHYFAFRNQELHDYGITRIYHPDDGRAMGLQGMINDVLKQCDFPNRLFGQWRIEQLQASNFPKGETGLIGGASLISIAENNPGA